MFLLLQEAKEQLSPLSVALERLQQDKQELLGRKRQRQEEGQEKVRDAPNGRFLTQNVHECFRSCLCLHLITCFSECGVVMFSVVNFVRLMP